MNVVLKTMEATNLFYDMSVIDFHRQEIKRGKRKKYIKLNNNSKQELSLKLQNHKDQIFDIEKICTNIYSTSNCINNYEDLYDYFSQRNLLLLIKKASCLDGFFPCEIIEGNFAWISKNLMGHYRYYSKSKDAGTIGLDIIDLLSIYYGLSPSRTIKTAIKLFNVKFMEDSWMEEQNKKYLSNLTIIHNSKKYIEKEYPLVYEYIKKHLKVLETMNVLGNINVKKKEFSYNNNNIFFASNSYISDFLGNYTASTTNKVLNLFATLGLIVKIAEKDIHPQLLHESRVIAEKRSLGNIISYYIVPPMCDTLDIAQQRAEVLNNYNIRYSNISKEKIDIAFGKDFGNRIYVQEIQKNKLKDIVALSYMHYCLEKNFLDLIRENSWVSKTSLLNIDIPNTDIIERKKEIEKIWRYLIIKHKLLYIKPTQEAKKHYNLRTNEYIAISEDLFFSPKN